MDTLGDSYILIPQDFGMIPDFAYSWKRKIPEFQRNSGIFLS
ncbi:hypothetical protein [Parabacteroides johnsonii]|nr:hypothetical protein [Parabacteroides johnsonii]